MKEGLIRSFDFGTVLINNVIQLCFVSLVFVVTVFWKYATSVQFDYYDCCKMPGSC